VAVVLGVAPAPAGAFGPDGPVSVTSPDGAVFSPAGGHLASTFSLSV
jgi:hypothetical protein